MTTSALVSYVRRTRFNVINRSSLEQLELLDKLNIDFLGVINGSIMEKSIANGDS